MQLGVLAEIIAGELIGVERPVEISNICFYPIQRQERDLLYIDLLWGDRINEIKSREDLCKYLAAYNLAAIIVTEKLPIEVPQIIVKNSLSSLMKLAKYFRQLIKFPFIALTGSLGKTTTRELICNTFLNKFVILQNYQSYNDLTAITSILARANSQHNLGVVELGAYHPGHIGAMTECIAPKMVMILGAEAVHLNKLQTIEGVASEKADIIRNAPETAIVILNADDQFYHYWQGLAGERSIVSFGIKQPADVMAKNIMIDNNAQAVFDLTIADQSIRIHLNLLGYHNVYNAIAASAVCYLWGLSLDEIKSGIENTHAVEQRLYRYTGLNNSTIFDDAFAAKKVSTIAALNVLKVFKGKKIFVFGNMTLEDDPNGLILHQEIGCKARELGIDQLYGLGNMAKHAVTSFGKNGIFFTDRSELIKKIRSELDANTYVLIKGAHYMEMSSIVPELQKRE